MITQTSPAGLNIGPISGPSVSAGIKIQPVSVQPIFQGQNAALNKLRTEEDIANKRELDRQNFLTSMDARFKASSSQGGGSGATIAGGVAVDGNTEIGRSAINNYNNYTADFQRQMADEVAKATDKNGRVDGVAAQRNIALLNQKYLEQITNDADIITATKSKLELDIFNKQIELAEAKKGVFVDKGKAFQTREAWRAAQDDPTGQTTFDRNLLNTSAYQYDEERLDKDLDDILVAAVKETEIPAIVSAAELGGGYTDADGSVLRTQTVQNERTKATRIANEMLANNEQLREYLTAKGYNPAEYMQGKLKKLLREDEQRILLKGLEGFDGVQSAARQRMKDQAAAERKGMANVYGFSDKSEGERKNVALANSFSERGYINIPSESQFTNAREERDNINKERRKKGLPILTDEHFEIDEESGEFIIREPRYMGKDKNGDPVELGGGILQGFGKPAGVNLREERFRAANDSYDWGNLEADPSSVPADFNASGNGFDASFVSLYETGNKFGTSSYNPESLYAVGDPSIGGSYGTFQMHKGVWNGFVDYLQNKHKEAGWENFNLNLTEEQLRSIDGMNGGNQKNIPNFIREMVGKIGVDKYQALEVDYLTKTRWATDLAAAKSLFGDTHPAVMTFVVDSANQSGQIGQSFIVKNAAAILRQKGLDPKTATPQQQINALSLARMTYFRSGQGKWKGMGNQAEQLISTRVLPITQQMLAWADVEPGVRSGGYKNPEPFEQTIDLQNQYVVGTPQDQVAMQQKVDGQQEAGGQQEVSYLFELTQSKKEFHKGFASMLNEFGNASIPSAEQGASGNPLRREILEELAEDDKQKLVDYTEINTKLTDGRKLRGAELVRLEKERDELAQTLLQDPEIRTAYLKISVPRELVQREFTERVVEQARSLGVGETATIDYLSGGVLGGMDQQNLEVTRTDDGWIVDLPDLSIFRKDQYTGQNIKELIAEVSSISSPWTSRGSLLDFGVSDWDNAAVSYMERNTPEMIAARQSEVDRLNGSTPPSAPATPTAPITQAAKGFARRRNLTLSEPAPQDEEQNTTNRGLFGEGEGLSETPKKVQMQDNEGVIVNLELIKSGGVYTLSYTDAQGERQSVQDTDYEKAAKKAMTELSLEEVRSPEDDVFKELLGDTDEFKGLRDEMDYESYKEDFYIVFEDSKEGDFELYTGLLDKFIEGDLSKNDVEVARELLSRGFKDSVFASDSYDKFGEALEKLAKIEI